MVEMFTPSTQGGPTMIMAQEKYFIKAQKEFDGLLSWIGQADEEGLRIDQVERGLFSRLLAIGFVLLEAFVAKFGPGDAGKTVGKRVTRCVVRQSRTDAGTCRSLES